MKIAVTEEDIKNGRRECALSCPIALAVRRAAKSVDVEVDGEIRLGGVWGDIFKPDKLKVATFIDRFDKDGTGQPFDFEVFFDLDVE